MKENAVYRGVRRHGQVCVTVEEEGVIKALRQVVHHSPAGFEWGYGGSGPADLALSILADFLGERLARLGRFYHGTLAWRLHQDFKSAFLAGIEKDEWEITGELVAVFVAERTAVRTEA